MFEGVQEAGGPQHRPLQEVLGLQLPPPGQPVHLQGKETVEKFTLLIGVEQINKMQVCDF